MKNRKAIMVMARPAAVNVPLDREQFLEGLNCTGA